MYYCYVVYVNIYPKVVGASVGLPGIWVLVAVTIGGGILGIGGMLLAVPLFAAAYKMIENDIEKRQKPKRKVKRIKTTEN